MEPVLQLYYQVLQYQYYLLLLVPQCPWMHIKAGTNVPGTCRYGSSVRCTSTVGILYRVQIHVYAYIYTLHVYAHWSVHFLMEKIQSFIVLTVRNNTCIHSEVADVRTRMLQIPKTPITSHISELHPEFCTTSYVIYIYLDRLVPGGLSLVGSVQLYWTLPWITQGGRDRNFATPLPSLIVVQYK